MLGGNKHSYYAVVVVYMVQLKCELNDCIRSFWCGDDTGSSLRYSGSIVSLLFIRV